MAVGENLPALYENEQGTIEVQAPTAMMPWQKPPYISKLRPEQQFRVLKAIVMADADHHREWRSDANTWFAFRAGEQWTEEDKAMLRDQKRPVITFNRVLAFMKAVAGMEINGRHDTYFYPINTEDTAPNEVLNAANRWMANGCDADDEQSDAFDKCATCGLGFTESRMEYDDDVAGKYAEECIDPREMVWDRSAKKKGLSDARRMARVRTMSLGDAMALFPGYSREQLDAAWARDLSVQMPATKSIEEKRIRDNAGDDIDAAHNDLHEVTIVHIQWIEKHCYYLIADPATNTKMELTEDEFEVLNKRFQMLGIQLQHVKLLRKVYRQAFLGDMMLRPAEPVPLGNRFSWNAVTGEYDAVKCSWFGLVKVLRDPQMWANKWLSQILHILNTTAKGGILAERDAFDDEREAEESFAKADRITWVEDGALSGTKPKVMPKPGPGMTDGYVNILQFAIQSFRDVTGLNLELMGQQDINQPGVLEAMRKQAGMTMLATLFDALRKFRKNVGRARLFIIQNYLSDGRLIRVTGNVLGEDTPKVVQLAREKTTGDYDVEVDDAPTSPNQKEATWLVIQPLIAVFKDQLMAQPEVLAVLLEYSPLPARIVAEIKKVILAGQNDPQAAAERQANMELMVRATIAQIMKDESTARKNDAQAETAQADAAYQIAMARNLLEDNEYKQFEGLLALMEQRAKTRTADANATAATAKAERERIGAMADLQNLDADRAERLAAANRETVQARREATGTLIDEITGMAKARRDIAGAMKDMADADLKRRTPARPPAGAEAK